MHQAKRPARKYWRGSNEPFEVFDASGNRLGLAPRSRVHREGLWHRAANVFLFRADGRLIVQRRHWRKDICAGAWDLSVAEHLEPGESYEQAALRGLHEELGVDDVALEPVGAAVPVRLEIPSSELRDFEFQQAFRGLFEGELWPNEHEVCATDVFALQDLASAFKERPGDFTPWFRDSAVRLGFCA